MPLSFVSFRPVALPFCVCLCLIVSVLLSGCDGLTYAPSGENRVDVESAPDPVAVPLADTMDVWGTQTIKYDADLKEDTFRNAYFLVNGEQFGESIRNGRIRIETALLQDGLYPFDLVVATRPGGATLAAQVGATTTTTLFSGVFRVVNEADPTLVDVSTSVQDGILRISWETSPARPPGFQAYTVLRTTECCGRGEQVVERIDDPRKTFVDDSLYTGGFVRYQVRMNARGRSVRREVEGTFVPSLSASLAVNGTEATVTWNPAPLTQTFRRYVVQRRLVRPELFREPTWFPVADVEDRNQTSFRETLNVFGGEFEYRVVNVSPIHENAAVASAPTTSFRPPRDTVSWGGLDFWERYLPALDAYIKNDGDNATQTYTTQLYDRASKTLRLEKSLPFDIVDGALRGSALSPDGARWYGSIDTLRIAEYDVGSLTRVKTHALKSFVPEVYHRRSPFELNASNNGRLFVGLNAYRSPTNYINRGLAIFDLSGDGPVLNDLFDLYVDNFRISFYSVAAQNVWGSGTHAFIDLDSEDVDHRSIYRIEPDTAVATFEISSPDHVFTRDGVDYYSQYDPRGFDETGVLSVYRASDGERVWEIDIAPGISSLEFDRGTGYFGSIVRKVVGDVTSNPTELYGRSSSYFIYSLDDGLIRDVPVVYGVGYRMSGGVLWSDNAYLNLFDPTQ